ncbi:MAG: hypothetical protein ACOY33_05650 [Pseudomonadota bacterium]
MSRVVARSLLVPVVLLLSAGLTGCFTSRHLPPAPLAETPAPAVLKNRSATVTTTGLAVVAPGRPDTRAKEAIGSWFATPASGSAADYDVSISEKTQMGGGFWVTVFCPYLCTLGILPAWGTETHTSELVIRSGGQEIYRDTQQTRVRSALSLYTPAALLFGRLGNGGRRESVDYLINAHRAALARRGEQENQAFAAAVQQGNAEAFRNYLRSNPQSFFRGEALRGLSALASRSGEPLAAHRQNLALWPDYGQYMAGTEALWFVGPAGMQVLDIGPALEKGTAPELLAAQIRAARQPYKVFSADDLAWLKGKGIPDTVVAAMLDATTASGMTMAAPATAAAAAAVPAATGMSLMAAPAPAAAGTPGAAGVKPTAGDIATQCAKKFAAMKACEQIPSFGASICKSQVNKTYSHIACAVIQ